LDRGSSSQHKTPIDASAIVPLHLGRGDPIGECVERLLAIYRFFLFGASLLAVGKISLTPLAYLISSSDVLASLFPLFTASSIVFPSVHWP
jgi:hypothetical protein